MSESLIDQFSHADESPQRRYRRMFVGSDSTADLVRYELVTSFFGPMPGALGYYLRSRTYPGLLGRAGRGVFFGRSLTLRCPGRIHLGDNVLVDDLVVLDAKGTGSRIEVGDGVLIGRGCILSCSDATISLGSHVSIGPFSHFASKSSIRIGSNVGIGSDVHVIAGGYDVTDPGRPVIMQERVSKGITIEDAVWVGVGVRILDGVTIGRNSIIGAGSVVTKDVAPFSVFLGNPGRVVQNRDRRAVARP
jgi:acetyltransferase-like isoleucine patch superfamily enzyme